MHLSHGSGAGAPAPPRGSLSLPASDGSPIKLSVGRGSLLRGDRGNVTADPAKANPHQDGPTRGPSARRVASSACKLCPNTRPASPGTSICQASHYGPKRGQDRHTRVQDTHVTALHTRHARIHACTHARYTHVRAHAAVNAHTATHTAGLDPPMVHASLNSHGKRSCFHLTRELGWERARRQRLRSRCWPPRVAVPPPGRVSVFWSYTDQHLGPNFGAQDQGFGAD